MACGGVVACNALTGSAELSVCDGPSCTQASGAGSSGGPGSADGGEGGVLPPGVSVSGDCTDGTKVCFGRVLATCVGNAWSRVACAEACGATPAAPDVAACVPWPSCRNGAGASCGTSPSSCCETKPVPGGTFRRRNSETYPATVAPFALDLYEVTVGRFRAFVESGGGVQESPPAANVGAHPKIPGSGWQSTWNKHLAPNTSALKTLVAGGTWTEAADTNENKPINNVDWLVAFAFCAWDGGRLPTFAEWGFAAAGGSEQRVYPWSKPPEDTEIVSSKAVYECGFSAPAYTCPATYCNVDSSSPCDPAACLLLSGACVTPACFGCDASSDIAPVGSRVDGVGPYGQLDLAGNVGELCLDAPLKRDSGRIPPFCENCASIMGPEPKGTSGSANDDYEVLFAGGGWSSGATELRNTELGHRRWSDRTDNVGFRCARD
jgi:formylglycine-generating enzyme